MYALRRWLWVKKSWLWSEDGAVDNSVQHKATWWRRLRGLVRARRAMEKRTKRLCAAIEVEGLEDSMR